VISYGIVKLNNQDGTIRYGTYEIEFFKPPVNITKRSQVDLTKHSMKVTIA